MPIGSSFITWQNIVITTCTIDELVGNLKKLHRNKQCDIYLCGDFNFDILNQANDVTNECLQCPYKLCMFPLIIKPTRITNHSSASMDNIFYNAFGKSHCCGILVNGITDHPPIFTIGEEILAISRDVPLISYMNVRSKSKKNMKIFCEKLAMESWHSMYNTIDVNTDYYNLVKMIDNLFSR